MIKEEFMAALAGILEVGRDQVSDSSELAEFPEWNSLSVMAFIAMADSKLGLAVSPKALKDAKKVSDLCELVKAKLQG